MQLNSNMYIPVLVGRVEGRQSFPYAGQVQLTGKIYTDVPESLIPPGRLVAARKYVSAASVAST